MTVFGKKEEYDFIIDNIEAHINVVVQALERGQLEESIIQFYQERNYNDWAIFLILEAAKLLFKDRRTAPPKKTLIRRIT